MVSHEAYITPVLSARVDFSCCRIPRSLLLVCLYCTCVGWRFLRALYRLPIVYGRTFPFLESLARISPGRSAHFRKRTGFDLDATLGIHRYS